MRFLCVAILLAFVVPAEARMPVALPRPLELAPLGWDLDVEQATKVLEAAKMAPKYDEVRRYMVRTKAEPWVRHTSEPGLSFAPRTGWRGYAHFAWNETAKAYRIDRMHHATDALTPAALKDELAALRARYGTPSSTRDGVWTWSQAGTTLTATWPINSDSKRTSLTIAIRRD